MVKISERKIFWILILVTAGLITLNGILTDVNLGDESHHYHFAQNIYWAGKRVAFSLLYESGNPPGFYYNNPPLWHLILAFLWRIAGGISQAIAQVYHILFFILLAWVTSLLAREISGEDGRWSSALLIVAVPMVVSFSTLFYMDIPMTALATLSFYLLWKKRYIEAGVASGLAFFTKLNAGFFFPGFLLVILWNERRRVWPLLKGLVFFIFPILIIYLHDSNWRKTNITGQMDTIGLSNVMNRFSMVFSGFKWKEYLNSYLTDVSDVVKYFGIVFLILLFLHISRFKRWDKRGNIMWLPVISYFVFLILLFGVVTDIRYLIPIVPFLIVIVTPSLLSLKKKWRHPIILLCIFQFISTSVYVYQKRKVPIEVKEGYEFVKKNLPKDALILYPEENLLIYGQRKVIWSVVGASEGYRLAPKALYSLLWPNNLEEMDNILRANHIDHILIKKSRIYEDHKGRHLGGYPQSFVGSLSKLNRWLKIFENQGVELWKKKAS